jgi:hypothetical protein
LAMLLPSFTGCFLSSFISGENSEGRGWEIRYHRMDCQW